MKYAGLLLAVHAVFDACHASETPGALILDLARSPVPRSQSLRRRAVHHGKVLAQIDNVKMEGMYLINVTIGTPPQPVTLQLDTGSSDLWVPGANTTVCEAGNCTRGDYNMSRSSTGQLAQYNQFEVAYADQSWANGSYITDTVHFGGASVPNATIGYATDLFDLDHGLMGVGYPALEGTTNKYPDIPLALYNANVTNTVAYSLWLNDQDASTGSILFGGIDRAKYHGELTLLDLWLEPNKTEVTRFLVMLSGVRAVSDSGSDALGAAEFPFTALLDSGTTYSYLPDDLAHAIFNETGAQYNDTGDEVFVPCDLVNSPGYLSFEFGGDGGAVVNVSMSELVFDEYAFELEGVEICDFGIHTLGSGASGRQIILGDSFLRSAYVVYDMANHRVAMSQTKYNVSKSEIVTFKSYGAPVPYATLAPDGGNGTGVDDAVTATATVEFSAATGFAESYASDAAAAAASSPSDSSTSGSSSDSSWGSSSSKEYVNIAGPAIGGAAAGLLALGAGVYAWRTMAAKKRNGKKRYAQVEGEAAERAVGDETKASLVAMEGEYGRLSQIQTAYRDDGPHDA